MEKQSKIWVAGSDTVIGAAIIRQLKVHGYSNVIDPGIQQELTNRQWVDNFIAEHKPQYIFLVGGKTAGIRGNMRLPAELMLDNLLIECNVIDSAWANKVDKLFYLASSCSYPKHCSQPMKESDLLTGSLEPTSEPYALAKIAGLKLIQSYRRQYGADFICGIGANGFGPGDDFSLEDSHVIGALICRMHQAKLNGDKQIVIWGTGKPRREFIYTDDLASACIFVMNNYSEFEPINLGSGENLAISELTQIIKEVIGFNGEAAFDSTKPDGMPVKALDSSKLRRLGWRGQWSFKDALKSTYQWFLENVAGDLCHEGRG